MADAPQKIGFYNYERTILNAYKEVKNELTQIKNSNDAYQLKTEEVGLLTLAVSTANELYIGGYASYLEVITAQRSRLQAELQQIELKKQIILNSVDLYRSLGGV